MNAIECRDLTKAYRGFTLDHLTFPSPPGASWGWWGKTGRASPPPMKLLMNAISRDEGQVSLLGVDNQSPEFLQTKQDIGWCWTRPACRRSSPPGDGQAHGPHLHPVGPGAL